MWRDRSRDGSGLVSGSLPALAAVGPDAGSPAGPPDARVGASLPEVTIAIVTWNARTLLETCLTSLAAVDYPADRLEVLVHDNGSRDGTSDWLALAWPRARGTDSPGNLGFAAPCNALVRTAAAPLVCLVNNDMTFAPDFLRRMVEAWHESGATCVGARICDATGERLEYEGGSVNLHGHGAPLGFGKVVTHGVGWRDTLFASGGAMLVERERFLAAGGFAADYFAYFEDVDLGWRLGALGQRCVVARGARVFHREHGSEAALGQGGRLVLLERNGLLNIVRNYGSDWAEPVFAWALALLAERMRLVPEQARDRRRALASAMAALPAARRAGRALAERRRVRDEAVVARFVEPLRPVLGGEEYAEIQSRLAREFGIDRLLERVGSRGVAASPDAAS